MPPTAQRVLVSVMYDAIGGRGHDVASPTTCVDRSPQWGVDSALVA
jgi:hypothetical protein